MVTQQGYREAMARFGAHVNVVTTDGPAGRRGFTASAVCSVTDAPPTLLVCVNRQNDSHPAMLTNGVLCVNALCADQQEISALFSRETNDPLARFTAGDWHVLETGAPALHGAVVSFDCRIMQVTEVGTHSVMFGQVVAIRHGDRHDGLVYFGRTYHPLRRPLPAG